MHTNWEYNKNRIEFAQKMLEREEALINEASKLCDLRFNMKASNPRTYIKLLSIFINKSNSKTPQTPAEALIVPPKTGEISTEPLPNLWDPD